MDNYRELVFRIEKQIEKSNYYIQGYHKLLKMNVNNTKIDLDYYRESVKHHHSMIRVLKNLLGN